MIMKKPNYQKSTKIHNRALQTTRDDNVKNISINLLDHDTAVMYYFKNIIQPSVVDNNISIKVPILYANQERWNSMQKDGFLRDKKNQIIIPAIAFRRTGIEKNDSLPATKIDAIDPKIFYSFEKRYTHDNRYDKFSVLIGNKPSREIYKVAMPNYITLSYDFIIWTTYVEQMNSIIEKINYTNGSYWGEPGKLIFRSQIDSFADATELSDGERIIKTEFSATLYGYLIPENFGNEITTKRGFTPKSVSFSTEVIKNYEDLKIFKK